MTDEFIAEDNVNEEGYDAVRVHIVADETVAVHTDTAEFGDGQTFPVSLAGAVNAAPVQILQRRPARHRAIICALGLTGVNTILLASRIDFLQGPAPTRGYTLSATNLQLEIKDQEPWYAIGLGAAGSLSVLDEGWL
jgi:hypothetical protein